MLRIVRATEAGFAYLLLMLALAVIGIAAAFAVSLGAASSRRDAELHLLAIGAEFERALAAYAATGGRAPGAGPRQLEDLLKDPRTAGLRRHLRQIYVDPLTGESRWGVIRNAQGSIVGVYSLAPGVPIKRSGFREGQESFVEADSYSQWTFAAGRTSRQPASGPQ